MLFYFSVLAPNGDCNEIFQSTEREPFSCPGNAAQGFWGIAKPFKYNGNREYRECTMPLVMPSMIKYSEYEMMKKPSG